MSAFSNWKQKSIELLWGVLLLLPALAGYFLHMLIPGLLLSLWLAFGNLACGWHSYPKPDSYKAAFIYLYHSLIWPIYSMKELRHRADGHTHDIPYIIHVSDFSIGNLSDVEYSRISLSVYQDIGVYFAQIVTLGKVLLRFFAGLLIALPVLFFWLYFACVVYLGTPAQSVTSVDFGNFMIKVASKLPYICLAVFIVRVAIGPKLGFVNEFRKEIQYKIRQYVGILPEGPIVLIREDRLNDYSPVRLRKAGIFKH